MNLLISDIPLLPPFTQNADNRYVDLSTMKISNCMGCFGCWVKTPGRCVIRDDATSVYPLIAQSSRLIYVSHVRYGGYDIVMKTMLERAIPIQKAFIRLYRGETHHVQRAVFKKDALIIAYGCTDEEERNVFRRLIARNANNMLFKSWRIIFTQKSQVQSLVEREAASWES